jgi:hypothetical protein
MVSKILAYEVTPYQSSWNTRATFIADNNDPAAGNFPVLSDGIADHYLGEGMTVDKIYLGSPTYPSASSSRTAIINAINAGRLLVNYTGHAAIDYWASEIIFETGDVSSLANTGKYPFFVSLTCQDGYFIRSQFPPLNYPSLAETLIRADNAGSIASFSPTGNGLANGHDLLAKSLYTSIYTNGTTLLGPATSFAKTQVTAGYYDLIDTFMLFGDPATRLKTSPTAVQLMSFTASVFSGGIGLKWESANEQDILGYNVYRTDLMTGITQKLNDVMILSTGQLHGAKYAFADRVEPGKRFYYWLELVKPSGGDMGSPIIVDSKYVYDLPALFR